MIYAIIFLAAAVLAVPIFKRIGLGAILGYLAAGALIGPSGFGLIESVEEVLHFSELGVVMLMFIIGLELEPARLWRMRSQVFVVGGLQAAISTAVLTPLILTQSVPVPIAAVIALGLSLSSTAFALQILADRHELTRPHGQASFGILLFQDLLAIPAIAIATLVSSTGGASGAPPIQPLHAIGAILGVIIGGKLLLRPLLRWIAATRNHELSISVALLVVLGTAEIMVHVGLTPSLGGFIAGVLLADSEYKHDLEANIDPFKGLLLGLFFIAVGMSAQLDILWHKPLLILLGTIALMAFKLVVLLGIGRALKLPFDQSINMGIALAAGGEFAFVVFATMRAGGGLPAELHGALILIVTCSMALIPILFLVRDRVFKQDKVAQQSREFDEVEASGPIVLAGFGRFNQIVGRVLRSKRIPFTALDNAPERVDFVRRFGSNIFYGDPARIEILRAARVAEARAIVVGVDGIAESVAIVKLVREHYPHVPVFARARDREHAYTLIELGAKVIVREMFYSSLEMAREVMEAIGMPAVNAQRAVERFRDHDEAQLRHQATIRDDDEALRASAVSFAAELERLFNEDAEEDFQVTP